MANKIIWTFDDVAVYHALVGPMNTNLKMIMLEIDDQLDEIITGEHISLTIEKGVQIEVLKQFLTIFTELYKSNIKLEMRDLSYLINILKSNKNSLSIANIISFYQKKHVLLSTFEGQKIYPKTFMQYEFIEKMEENQVIFATGSAGTGKTYLAMAYAVSALKKNRIKKIIITRPAVEAGEKLGFLPGDLKEKVDPYLIPIYDALDVFLGKEQVTKLVEKGVIEIAPLAYMRGRTLDNAYIILDEAQNTTTSQMQMFLTRLGFNSKMIITGDITQIDLPRYATSGLVEAKHLLHNINGLTFVEFTKNDVMRHPIVAKIIEKYEKAKLNEDSND